MCRHLCYLGPPVAPGSLLFDLSHSLSVQSYAPKDMRGGGKVNADGFGLAWWNDADAPGLHRYRRSGPIWQDAGFATLAGAVRSGAFVAAVRNATAGMPVTETAAAPFVGDGWAFSLNGRIDGWPGAAVKLAGGLDVEQLLTLDAPTDAALLWAVVRSRLASGSGPDQVLREVVAEVLAAAPKSRLNLLLSDGETAWATTVTHALWARSDPAVLASEPLDDDPSWHEIPDGSLVQLDRDDLIVEPLNPPESPRKGELPNVHQCR